jgi:Xaa-Pro aminopeptidase
MFDWDGRLGKIADFCRCHDLDAIVISSAVNVRYLTGFTGSAGLLIVTPETECLITDGRYEAFVRGAMEHGRMGRVTLERVEARYDLTLAARIRSLKPGTVGIEAEHVTVGTLNRWRASVPDAEWRPVTDMVERLRLIKDDRELDVLRRGGGLLSGVAGTLSSWVRAGRTEVEIARDIDRALERAGFERPAFDTIVAAGPNSAYPHARPTDRPLVKGDLVVLDFGGVLDGYCVDLTRMAAVGAIDSAAGRLYDAVRAAQDAALAAVRPGARGTEVDAAARDVLDARGLGAAFLHGTGHGLGLEVHEAPRLARTDSGAQDVLAPGMVCTIEPGAYLEGLGGVRLEDDVVVTTGDSERLTDASRDLLVV